jgi:PAS domain S-box-containing protein
MPPAAPAPEPPSGPAPRAPWRRAGFVAAVYAAFAGLWIFFSDRALGLVVSDPEQLVRWSVYKGFAFVLVTSVLLLLTMRRTFGAIEAGYAELTAHKTELEHARRLYAALSQINQAIVLSRSRDELFAKACNALVGHGGFGLAWVGWEDAETKRIGPVAVAGDQNDYVKNLVVYSDERPEGRGPTGTAFRSGRPYVCNDLLHDPAALPWREEIRRRGFRASAALPVRLGGRVRAVLNVYAAEAGFFREQELALLDEAANDLGFALDNFAREAAREEAERKVRRERDFSDALLASLPGVVYLYDRHGKFLRWNRNFERASGYTAAEVAALHPLDVIAEPDRARVADRIAGVFERGEEEVEAGFLTKDGRVIPYYFTGVAVQFAEEPCLVGVGLDIAERRRAEDARHASEARYRTLFDQAPDGIVIADARSNYLDANASMCRMLGYTHGEFVRLNAADIIVPEEAARIDAVLGEIRARNEHHREWRFRRKDGSVFPAEVIATLMPDGNILGMIRDITERKAAERSLHELNESLERRVVGRTAEMQAAVARAEAADRVKSAFLATMSHELRTPLNSIIGFTGILLQGLAGPVNAEQHKQLGMVRGSARHLLELINDVLDLSKIEANQLEVHPAPFDLPASLDRVLASLRPQAEKKSLVLRTDTAAAPATLVGDRRRTEQILLNLLNNAVKFTERGTVTFAVEAVPAFAPPGGGAPQPAVRFRIADTGIGIKADDLAHLFQPFRQIDSGLTRQHEGTGLGLAICRRLAALLHGEISVASEWGRGSIFSVTLPLRPPS